MVNIKMSEDWNNSNNLLAPVTTAFFLFRAFIDQVMHFFDYKLLEMPDNCICAIILLHNRRMPLYLTSFRLPCLVLKSLDVCMEHQI